MSQKKNALSSLDIYIKGELKQRIILGGSFHSEKKKDSPSLKKYRLSVSSFFFYDTSLIAAMPLLQIVAFQANAN